MKKLIIGIVAVVVLLVAAALIAPFLIPTGTYTRRLVALVKQSTGRDLTIAGPVRLTFLPTLALDAKDIRFANAPGAKDKDMLRLKQLDVELRLLPLLHGAVEVARFALIEPVISLEIDKQGRPNWVFAAARAAGSAPRGAAPAPAAPSAAGGRGFSVSEISLDDVRIENGRISYRDDRTGKTEVVDKVNMKLSLPNLGSKFIGDGSAVWNSEKVALAVNVVNPRALMDGGKSGLGLSLSARPIRLGFQGDATGVPPTRLAGTVDLAVPSLRDLAKWVGSPLPPGGGLGKLAIKGKLDMAGPKIAFNDATIALDAINAQGAFSVVTGGVRPVLAGKLQVDKLDLNPYLPPEKGPAAASQAAPAPATPAGKPAPAAATGWSDAPIDVAGLKAADADFDLRAGGILYRKIVVGPSALQMHLKGGKLTADLNELSLYHGKGKGKVMLDGSGAVPSLALDFDLSGVEVEPLLQAAANMDRFSGTGKIALDVTGRGKSQRAIVSALNGKGAFNLANGQIKGVNLIAMAQNATAALTGASAADKTDFGSLTGTFTIANGLMRNNDMQLKSGVVPVTGAGTVNLPERTVDYRVVVSLAGAVGVPVIVSGPWDNLSYRPDLGGIVKGITQQPGKALEQLKGLGGSVSKPGDLLKNLNPFGK